MNRLLAAIALTIAALPALAADNGAAPEHARHLGVASCASSLCHGSAKPTLAYSVTQNEYVTWSHFDPHASAYRVLLDERAAAIAHRLGLPHAYEAKECLDCHTDNVPRADRGPRFQLTDGVGCERCHGGSESWIASHDDAPKVTHAQNLANGMTALERPRVRAEVCLDCHVGNDTQFANHRLMAAGHPRLGFELDTFTELWRTSGGREHYRVDDDYRTRKGAASASATWSAGLFAQIERQQQLIRGPRFNTGSLFPELALFNCYSCHRSMRLKRWQDKGGGDLSPGSLRFDDASLRMLEALVAARKSSELQALRDAIRRWQLAASGARSVVVSESEALTQRVHEIDREITSRDWNRSETQAALDYLVAGATRGDYPDYASAEQAAMSVVVLLAELGEPQQSRAIDDLFSALTDDDRYDASRFRQILSRLKAGQH
jgi:hypothetical protein